MKEIPDIIKNHAKKSKISGISVGIITKDGTKTFNYGQIKKESGITPTEDTVYEIGSMTKTFTAILTAKLQEEELLSLQDPITKFLPEFAGSEFDKKNVTLFQLLTHTSGIEEFSLKTFIPQILSVLIHGKSIIPQYNYNTQNFLDYVSKLKLRNSRTNDYMYSNIGFGLVGKILERITNSTYEELVKNRICNVLGMKDTGISVFETHKNNMAAGYSFRNKKADYWNVFAIEAAGSLRSTASDMIKFLKANLGLNKTELSPTLEYCQNTRVETSMTMLTKIFPKLFGITLSKFRLGWNVFSLGNVEGIGHDGGTEGFTSFMIMNPKNQSAVVILTNRAMKPVHKLGISLLKEMDGKIT